MAPLKTVMVTSYDQKTKKIKDEPIFLRCLGMFWEAFGGVLAVFLEVFGGILRGFSGGGRKGRLSFYAHIEIVVTFLVVNIFGFLVITRNQGSYEGRR